MTKTQNNESIKEQALQRNQSSLTQAYTWKAFIRENR